MGEEHMSEQPAAPAPPPTPPPPPTSPPSGQPFSVTPGQPYQPDAGEPVAEHASFGSRFVALVVDQLLIGIVPTVLGGMLILAGRPRDCLPYTYQGSTARVCAMPAKGGLLGLGFVVLLLGWLVVAYFLWAKPVGEGRQTIGQRMMGVRVVDAQTGDPAIGVTRAYARWLFRTFISPLVCYLGFLWALWDDRQQAWQDKAVNTLVLKG
jgi:uncharacterized RDD family membrane protein YckC